MYKYGRLNKQSNFELSVSCQLILVEYACLCDKPVALITLLDETVNWIKVRSGSSHEVMPSRTSFCQYTVKQDELLIINDATMDHRFDNNDLVQSDPFVRFYAGMPLILSSGLKLGTLCLFDLKPGDLDDNQKKLLSILARQVVFLMELKLKDKLLEEQLEEIRVKNDSLIKIAYIQSHNIRQPLTSIMGLVGLV